MYDSKSLKESIKMIPSEKIADVSTRLDDKDLSGMDEIKSRYVKKVINLTDPILKKEATSVLISEIREKLLKIGDEIDFHSIDSIISSLHTLFFYVLGYEQVQKSIQDYLELKGIAIEELDQIDKSCISNLTIALSDFPFLPPSTFFENSLEDILRLQRQIEINLPKFDPYGAWKTYLFDLSTAINGLIKSYKNGNDLAKIMKHDLSAGSDEPSISFDDLVNSITGASLSDILKKK